MFTGIVEETGRVTSRVARGPGARIAIGCTFPAIVLGESIAVDGVCLTALGITSAGFEADASKETLDRTTLGALAPGDAVHLERATPLGGRMGGHVVTGHVDATGTVVSKTPIGEAVAIRFALPRALAPFVAEKGSIAVSGVSLTVNAVGADWFEVAIIPHTQAVTKLERIGVGGRVNLEVDPLARYVVRAITALGGTRADDALVRALAAGGYLEEK